MSPEGEGVDGPRVLHLAGRLEEGRSVRRGRAARPQQDHAGRLGLLLLGEVQEDTWVQDVDSLNVESGISINLFIIIELNKILFDGAKKILNIKKRSLPWFINCWHIWLDKKE